MDSANSSGLVLASVFVFMLFPLLGMPSPSPLPLDGLSFKAQIRLHLLPETSSLTPRRNEQPLFLAVDSLKGYVFFISRMLPISTTPPPLPSQAPSTGPARSLFTDGHWNGMEDPVSSHCIAMTVRLSTANKPNRGRVLGKKTRLEKINISQNRDILLFYDHR